MSTTEYDFFVVAAHPDDAEVPMGRLFGLAYAEVFKSHSHLPVTDPTVFLPALHG